MEKISKKDLQTVEGVLTIIFFKNGEVTLDKESIKLLREHKEFILALLGDE